MPKTAGVLAVAGLLTLAAGSDTFAQQANPCAARSPCAATNPCAAENPRAANAPAAGVRTQRQSGVSNFGGQELRPWERLYDIQAR